MESNTIVLIDDDEDDIFLIKEAIKKLGLKNEIIALSSGIELKEYLVKSSKSPFLIICDVNLPPTNGFEVRKMVLEDKLLRYKSVPFIFWSTAATEKQIQEGYDLPAQGFFLKSTNFDELCSTLQTIYNYWLINLHPKAL